MAYTRPSAFHLQNIICRLSVPMHGIVLQMLVFIFSYYGGLILKSVMCGDCSIRVFDTTVLLEYLDFYFQNFGGGRGHMPLCPPLDSPLVSVIKSSETRYLNDGSYMKKSLL